MKQFKVVLGTVDCRQLCRTKKKIGRNRCECEAAGELEQAQPQRPTHKQDIHHTNEPRKQFKLKSPLSVTDRGEIQLEFQTRASTQRRGPIHNRMSLRAAATNKALGHHDGCCPTQTAVRYTLGAWGPVHCYSYTLRAWGPVQCY